MNQATLQFCHCFRVFQQRLYKTGVFCGRHIKWTRKTQLEGSFGNKYFPGLCALARAEGNEHGHSHTRSLTPFNHSMILLKAVWCPIQCTVHCTVPHSPEGLYQQVFIAMASSFAAGTLLKKQIKLASRSDKEDIHKSTSTNNTASKRHRAPYTDRKGASLPARDSAPMGILQHESAPSVPCCRIFITLPGTSQTSPPWPATPHQLPAYPRYATCLT